MSLLPPQFLFRYAIPLRRLDKPPRGRRSAFELPAEFELPHFGDAGDVFARVASGWNEAGLALVVQVTGKSHPPACDVNRLAESDALEVWIDTRATENIHRASRYCHRLVLLPAGGGKDGERPLAVQRPIPQAREEPPPLDVAQIDLAAKRTRDGYRLSAWLPGALLNGWDPAALGKLRFYYALRDSELGDQFLAVGREFPFEHDPRLWATLELVD
ncbi:MAG: hypothetical protein KY476_22540 [Planctomycetes bacterium]|nr:hypothetical protein [Planctomycetota bacterium]